MNVTVKTTCCNDFELWHVSDLIDQILMGFPSLYQYDIFLGIESDLATGVSPCNESTFLHMFGLLLDISSDLFHRAHRFFPWLLDNNWFWFLFDTFSNHIKLLNNLANVPLNNKTHLVC